MAIAPGVYPGMKDQDQGIAERDALSDSTAIWRPNPSGVIGEHRVRLRWFNHSINNEILRPYTYVEPDTFRIFSSDQQMNGFSKVAGMINDGEYTYTIEGLKKGNPYWFYVISEKEGYDPYGI